MKGGYVCDNSFNASRARQLTQPERRRTGTPPLKMFEPGEAIIYTDRLTAPLLSPGQCRSISCPATPRSPRAVKTRL